MKRKNESVVKVGVSGKNSFGEHAKKKKIPKKETQDANGNAKSEIDYKHMIEKKYESEVEKYKLISNAKWNQMRTKQTQKLNALQNYKKVCMMKVI